MKRVFSLLILFVLILLIYQITVIYFKDDHEKEYKISVEDKIFEVKERFQKKLGNTYYLEITHDDDNYFYVLENDYNKQEKIIEEIKFYEEDGYKCIYPILIKGKTTNIECSKDGKLYTDIFLRGTSIINNFLSITKEYGYDGKNLVEDTEQEYEQLSSNRVYLNNLNDDIITVWDYKGIEIVNKKLLTSSYPLSFDKYENNHGYLVGRYYVVPIYTSSKVNEFASLSVIDIVDNKLSTIKLGYTLSSDTYINGIVDNKLYYMDPSNLIQLEVSIEKKDVRLVGDKDKGAQLYNGEWSTVNIYDLINSKVAYKSYKPTEIEKINKASQIIESASSYYYYDGKSIYQVSKNNLDKPILLFNVNTINNLIIKDDNIYYVQNDTLYRFSLKTGIKRILVNNELKYNTTNRIGIY